MKQLILCKLAWKFWTLWIESANWSRRGNIGVHCGYVTLLLLPINWLKGPNSHWKIYRVCLRIRYPRRHSTSISCPLCLRCEFKSKMQWRPLWSNGYWRSGMSVGWLANWHWKQWTTGRASGDHVERKIRCLGWAVLEAQWKWWSKSGPIVSSIPHFIRSIIILPLANVLDSEKLKVDFTPLYQCIHIYATLDSIDDLRRSYQADRKVRQCSTFSSRPLNLNTGAIRSHFTGPASACLSGQPNSGNMRVFHYRIACSSDDW